MQYRAGSVALAPRGVGWVRHVPSLVEAALVAAAIALLLPGFERLAEVGAGRDQRFADVAFRVDDLPPPSLPAVCDAVGAQADPALRSRLCVGAPVVAAITPLSRLPPPLADALNRSTRAFLAPVEATQSRLGELQLRQREGIGELRGLSDEAAALTADIQPFIERFRIVQGNDPGPAPLRCAARGVEAALADPLERPQPKVDAVLLLSAALDGHPQTEALAQATLLPPTASSALQGCPETGLGASLASTSAVLADARQAALSARKNEAVRGLWRTAGWQWAGAMALGFVFLVGSRRGVPPAIGASAALALWALAGWTARVPWPFGGSRQFEPARIDAAWTSPPAPFVWLLAAAALLCLLVWRRRRGPPPARQSMSSRLGYPGLVLATGLGWLLLLELSAHAHAGNRYLALYHQGHLWLAMLVFSLLLFLRQSLARGLAWALSVAGEAARGARRRLGTRMSFATGAVATLVFVVVAGLLLSNMRQLTSELGRIWLIVGAAWFFFLRGDPLAERLATAPVGASVLRYVAPMAFVVSVLVGFMLVTRDMGPLLIAGYAGGAFLAAAVAMWWHRRGGARGVSFALAALLFTLWIAGTTMALFSLGAVDAVTAQRLESLAAPLASSNDQLALVAWFQRAAPHGGFGLAAVPWCGYAAGGGCGGVPAQIHSDYSFTAIVGVFGTAAAWTAAIGSAVWLHRLIRHHGRVTRGEPRFVRVAGRFGPDGQAFLSWVALAWVVLTLCQLAVTVAGNLAVLPLTGVTFPFVSFGLTSLVVNMAFLALVINVDLPAEATHG
jgi:cell division protein FtsW (lipid II flippase)